MEPKLTFKKEKPLRGLSSIGHGDTTLIKSDGKVVGTIQQAHYNSNYTGWKLGVMILKPEPDKNPNCDWKWIFFKKTFEKEEQAREYLQKNWAWLNQKYTLRQDANY